MLSVALCCGKAEPSLDRGEVARVRDVAGDSGPIAFLGRGEVRAELNEPRLDIGDILGSRVGSVLLTRRQAAAVGVERHGFVDENPVEPIAIRISAVFLGEVGKPHPAPGVAIGVKFPLLGIVERFQAAGLDLGDQRAAVVLAGEVKIGHGSNP